MTISEILFLILTIAVVVLVVFLVVLICRTCKTLKSIQNQIDDLGHEPRELMRNANEITTDVSAKMKCFDPVFRAVSNLGEGLEQKTSSFKERSFEREEEHRSEHKRSIAREESPAEDIAELVLSGISLWKKLKKKR